MLRLTETTVIENIVYYSYRCQEKGHIKLWLNQELEREGEILKNLFFISMGRNRQGRLNIFRMN